MRQVLIAPAAKYLRAASRDRRVRANPMRQYDDRANSSTERNKKNQSADDSNKNIPKYAKPSNRRASFPDLEQ
jgi:hypothetical protein